METPILYKKGEKFLVFQNYGCNGYATIKEVMSSEVIDGNVTIDWTDGSSRCFRGNVPVEILPYIHEEWNGEIMRKWWHLINGTKREFTYSSKLFGEFTMELTVPPPFPYFEFNNTEGSMDPPLDDGEFEDHYSISLKRNIGEKFSGIPYSYEIEAIFVPRNKLAQVQSFCDVLVCLFPEDFLRRP
ncbi:MAG: hypothetical protein NTV03_00865 [Candidatus Nomurabacteria bacterium]|nr:hypothetical protein [Candidatus Nomurabacteria bacterium]